MSTSRVVERQPSRTAVAPRRRRLGAEQLVQTASAGGSLPTRPRIPWLARSGTTRNPSTCGRPVCGSSREGIRRNLRILTSQSQRNLLLVLNTSLEGRCMCRCRLREAAGFTSNFCEGCALDAARPVEFRARGSGAPGRQSGPRRERARPPALPPSTSTIGPDSRREGRDHSLRPDRREAQ
jgi:hypothetical protein